MMKIEAIEQLIKMDKELTEHSICMEMATHYKKNKYNYGYQAIVRQRAEKELEQIKREADNGLCK